MGKRILYIVLALALLAGVAVALNSSLFSVDHVQVTGNILFTEEQIAALGGIDENTNLFRADLDEVKAGIEQSPYLTVTSVVRKPPDTLVVTLTERQACAVVQSAENLYFYIDEETRVLEQGENSTRIVCPEVKGLTVASAKLGEQLVDLAEDPYPVQVLSSVLKELNKQDFSGSIEEIQLYNPEEILLKTRSGYGVKIGQADQLTRKVQWLRAVMPEVTAMGYEWGTIDVTGTGHAGFNPYEDLFGIAPPEALTPPSEAVPEGEGTEEGAEDGTEGNEGGGTEEEGGNTSSGQMLEVGETPQFMRPE